METGKVTLRRLADEDEKAFVSGIRDKSLRTAYGFPADMEDDVSSQIFHRFCGMSGAFALISRPGGEMIGFLLDVDPELPESIRAGLPKKGRTLAFAVFPPRQRQGYMEEALRRYIGQVFHTTEAAYIHCGHFTDNAPSRNLLRKLGFHEYSQHRSGNRIIVDEILFRFSRDPACPPARPRG